MNNKEISPGIFIPMLEKFGHADRLNQYVVAHVLKDALTLENKVPLKIAINISPKVIKIDSHIEVLVNMVKAHQEKLNQKRILIEFEITESSFTHGNFKLLRKALNMTKKAGITCAMDDFGVEYSSISRLTEFSFDMVKIDQFFIQKLDKKNGKLSKAVIKVLVQLAEDLGFVLLAEGAEKKKQVHHLIELGCEYVQGFYYYKPMPIKSINQIIK
jgi:EAL domain-containing protein (putative c-di-GMP-specific phosphodiesterase class I)